MAKRTKIAPKHRYLFLMRHAKATPFGKEGESDFERALTEKGQEDALKVAAVIKSLGFVPDRVLCSPSVRTRQTLKALSGLVPGLRPNYGEELYLIDHESLQAKLRRTKDDVSSVLVVGHNPGIEMLALLLIDPKAGGDLDGLARMQAKYPTGALTVLKLQGCSWADLAPGTCRLEAFVRPKDVETPDA